MHGNLLAITGQIPKNRPKRIRIRRHCGRRCVVNKTYPGRQMAGWGLGWERQLTLVEAEVCLLRGPVQGDEGSDDEVEAEVGGGLPGVG